MSIPNVALMMSPRRQRWATRSCANQSLYIVRGHPKMHGPLQGNAVNDATAALESQEGKVDG
jgi:hypothetical protein